MSRSPLSFDRSPSPPLGPFLISILACRQQSEVHLQYRSYSPFGLLFVAGRSQVSPRLSASRLSALKGTRIAVLLGTQLSPYPASRDQAPRPGLKPRRRWAICRVLV